MAIQIGDSAPDFTLSTKTADGPKLVSLSEFKGSKNVVLLFFPMAYTGTCTTEMCDVTQSLSSYASLDAEVLGISGDNPFAQEAWAEKEGIKVPLLSDYEHAVAKAYGVAYESFLPAINLPMGGVAKRSAFVIDKTGVVKHVEVLEDAREVPDFNKIQEALSSLS